MITSQLNIRLPNDELITVRFDGVVRLKCSLLEGVDTPGYVETPFELVVGEPGIDPEPVAGNEVIALEFPIRGGHRVGYDMTDNLFFVEPSDCETMVSCDCKECVKSMKDD